MITIYRHLADGDAPAWQRVQGKYRTISAAMFGARRLAGRGARFVTFGHDAQNGRPIVGYIGPSGTFEIRR